MASIKCGRCSGYHESVADVRACYNGERVSSQAATTPRGKALSDGQVRMARVLLGKASLVYAGPVPLEDLDRWGAGRTLIDQLKAVEYAMAAGKPYDLPAGCKQSARPRSAKASEALVLPDVPEGHYATPSLTGNNDYDFWRVDRPDEGDWAGKTFVKRVIGGKPDANVRGRTRREALEAIEAFGIDKARETYGQEIGRCWRCNRHLTDETSRALGIGPDCRQMVK